jgi:hypothetical protein
VSPLLRACALYSLSSPAARSSNRSWSASFERLTEADLQLALRLSVVPGVYGFLVTLARHLIAQLVAPSAFPEGCHVPPLTVARS